MKKIIYISILAIGCGANQTPWTPIQNNETQLCFPNMDQQIEASEFPLFQEQSAEYWVGGERDLDFLIGQTEEEVPIWNFQGETEDDQLVEIGAVRLGSQWYASHFSGGEWVIANDSEEKSVGIYRFDDSALWLLGVSSSEEDPEEGQTLLIYDDPVALLRFPMVVGDSFTQEADIGEGISNGLPFVGTHRYDVNLRKIGELYLDGIIFSEALRVNTRFTVIPNIGDSFSVNQSSFFSECFGELVRLESELNASDFSFSSAQTIRRFSFLGE